MEHKVSKAEILAKFKTRQIEKFGGEKKFQSHLSSQRKSIGKALIKAKEPNQQEKLNYQKRTGRGYNE